MFLYHRPRPSSPANNASRSEPHTRTASRFPGCQPLSGAYHFRETILEVLRRPLTSRGHRFRKAWTTYYKRAADEKDEEIA